MRKLHEQLCLRHLVTKVCRGINHGTWLHVAHEEGLISNSSMHVGIRGPTVREKADLENDVRCGFEIIDARAIDVIGIEAIVDQIKETIGSNRVYISVDIDVLDPAFAPGICSRLLPHYLTSC
jgi:agmatinase